MNIVLSQQVIELFPQAQVAVLVCRGLDNSPGRPAAEKVISGLEQHALDNLFDGPPGSHPYLAAWRAAYRAFGTDPRSHTVSSEALFKRFRKSRELPRISPAVDIYNLVSVVHMLPLGGYDRTELNGDIVLVRASGGEAFEPLGSNPEPERVNPGEVVYRDDDRVLTRHWNHRDSARTAIDVNTRDAIFFCEAPDNAVPAQALADALDELRTNLADVCGGQFAEVTLTSQTPSVSLTDLQLC
jgi:DNA/RNA-binding domain of Phe-tRNA-synthetase-like protein